MKIKNFKDLEIWQRSVALVEEIYRLTQDFPTQETYGLTSQIRKSAVSIPSNIAEGFGRFYNSEYKQFLFVAIGSAAELATQVTIAEKLKYLRKEDSNSVLDEIEQISKMTMSLIKKIVQKK